MLPIASHRSPWGQAEGKCDGENACQSRSLGCLRPELMYLDWPLTPCSAQDDLDLLSDLSILISEALG